MAYTVAEVLTMAQRILNDVEDDAYRDTTTGEPMLSYMNEGIRRFATETNCCQTKVNVSVTGQSMSFSNILSSIGPVTASGILVIHKVVLLTGTNHTPLPKAPISEMKSVQASTVTTPTRYSVFGGSVYFDTHHSTTVSYSVAVYCSYIPPDALVSATVVIIPDKWIQAIVKYIVFCCHIADRSAGLANGAYQEFEAIKQAAAKVHAFNADAIPGVV